MEKLICHGCKKETTVFGSAIEDCGKIIVFCNHCSMGSDKTGDELIDEMPLPELHFKDSMAELNRIITK